MGLIPVMMNRQSVGSEKTPQVSENASQMMTLPSGYFHTTWTTDCPALAIEQRPKFPNRRPYRGNLRDWAHYISYADGGRDDLRETVLRQGVIPAPGLFGLSPWSIYC
jgi:hypothetical protein